MVELVEMVEDWLARAILELAVEVVVDVVVALQYHPLYMFYESYASVAPFATLLVLPPRM